MKMEGEVNLYPRKNGVQKVIYFGNSHNFMLY